MLYTLVLNRHGKVDRLLCNSNGCTETRGNESILFENDLYNLHETLGILYKGTKGFHCVDKSVIEISKYRFITEASLHPPPLLGLSSRKEPCKKAQAKAKMPGKNLFDEEDGVNKLLTFMTKLNQVMAGVSKVKTVEELQVFIENLNRVYNEIKLQITGV